MTVQARLALWADALLKRPRNTAAAETHIRLSQPGDRDAILRFIAEQDFDPRDATTWDGLCMSAMTAWQGSRLVGAIPLEPRWWQVRPGCVLPIVHQTTVGVAPEFRGRGIGSAMQEAIYAHEPASIATVFREDETSRAYRWYRQNGFERALRITAWATETQTNVGMPSAAKVLDPADGGVDWAGIDGLWHAQHVDYHGGFTCRRRRSLKDWIEVHPYRNQYRFRILHLHDADTLAAYAVLGIGKLHSQTTRVEIMEHAAREGSADLVNQLCRATVSFATQHGYRPVRWAMAADDPDVSIARQNGFEPDWGFDLLWRPLPSCEETLPGMAERTQTWRYHSLDYA